MSNVVTGFEGLYQAMDELEQEIGTAKTDRIWRGALKQAMEPVLIAAKDRAPKDTGQLAAHITATARRPTARDRRSMSYAGEAFLATVTSSAIRNDTVRATELTKKGKFKNKYQNVKPVPVSQEFGNARTPAHPYMRLALETNADAVISRLGKILWAEINWGKYSKG